MADRHAAIVAHGQPGDPAPLQAQIEALAARVAALLPGWRVDGATLADADSLSRLRGVDVILPLFMADGWFTRSEMPRRLKRAGVEGARILPPFGADPALPAIGLHLAVRAARAAGIDPARATLVVAGHGSSKSTASADATRDFAALVATQTVGQGGFARVLTGFIEEPPFLRDVTVDGPAVCLPFFATLASHTTQDIPDDWATAGNTGPIAPPVGLADEVPALLAAALRAATEG